MVTIKPEISTGPASIPRRHYGQWQTEGKQTQEAEANQGAVMRYLAILAIWTALFFLPQYAGDWYNSHFHLYQSLVSLILMVSVANLTDDWWKAEYLTLCALQILHNLGDFIFDFPASNYSQIQGILNALEIALILLAGGLTQLHRMTYGRDAAGSHGSRGPDDAAQSTSSRWRDA